MFGVEPVTGGPRTRVQLAIRFRIQGGLAQFNRSDLVESFADVVLADFVRNCERALAGEETEPGASGLALLWRTIRAKFGTLSRWAARIGDPPGFHEQPAKEYRAHAQQTTSQRRQFDRSGVHELAWRRIREGNSG